MTETLHTVDGRGMLRIERTFAHPPRKVWRAVTEPEHLRHWFPFAVELELHPGATITFFELGDDTAPALHGRVTEADPPRVFAFEWEGDELRFELHAEGAGTRLVFTHVFDDTAGAASFTAGWMTCLDALELVLDGRPVAQEPDMVAMDAAHEHYVAAFGLSEGTATATAQGWEVRFERQLTRHAETVWQVLDGAAEPAVGAPPPAGFTRDGLDAGPVTAVEPARLLEYEWHLDGEVAGRVRWELTQGTGHGARLILTQSGPAAASRAREDALRGWRTRTEALAAHLLRTERPAPHPAGT